MYNVSSLGVHEGNSQYWHGTKPVAMHGADVPYMEDTRNHLHQLVPPREPPSNLCNHTSMILTNGNNLQNVKNSDGPARLTHSMLGSKSCPTSPNKP